MNRFIVSVAAVSVIFSLAAAPRAAAQMAQQLVGTWSLVSAVAHQDGAQTNPFGPNPSGTLMFGSDGRYALIFLRTDLPKLASNNRMAGTPDENRVIAQGASLTSAITGCMRRTVSWSSISRKALFRTGMEPSSGERSRSLEMS